MRRLTIILALVAIAFTSMVLAADPPELLNYQGVLRNSSDEPLDGGFPMTFRFFDAVMGGWDGLDGGIGKIQGLAGLEVPYITEGA